MKVESTGRAAMDAKRWIGYMSLSFLFFEVDGFSDEVDKNHKTAVVGAPTYTLQSSVSNEALSRGPIDIPLNRETPNILFQKIYTAQRGYTWMEGIDDSEIPVLHREI